ERRHAPLEHRDRRIVDAAVTEAFGLKVEQRGGVLRTVELVGCGLIDRHRHRLGGWLDVVARMNRNGLAFHALNVGLGLRVVIGFRITRLALSALRRSKFVSSDTSGFNETAKNPMR